jgi:hypothetical protein
LSWHPFLLVVSSACFDNVSTITWCSPILSLSSSKRAEENRSLFNIFYIKETAKLVIAKYSVEGGKNNGRFCGSLITIEFKAPQLCSLPHARAVSSSLI